LTTVLRQARNAPVTAMTKATRRVRLILPGIGTVTNAVMAGKITVQTLMAAGLPPTAELTTRPTTDAKVASAIGPQLRPSLGGALDC
jgi:hypothetical protein